MALNPSDAVRRDLIDTLRLDLVGPGNDHPCATELLPAPPTRWYLCGFLVPAKVKPELREDKAAVEEIDEGGAGGGTDDAAPPEPAAARRSLLPSSMGLSVLVAPGVTQLEATAEWGEYVLEGDEMTQLPGDDEPEPPEVEVEGTSPDTAQPAAAEGTTAEVQPRRRRGFRRMPRSFVALLPLPADHAAPVAVPIDDHGLRFVVTARDVPAAAVDGGRLPAGVRSVSVFLVNDRGTPDDSRLWPLTIFQANLRLRCEVPFVPRPDLRGTGLGAGDDYDDSVSDLQYRDVVELAVGHGTAARALPSPAVTTETVADQSASRGCREVETLWIPDAGVERVEVADVPGVELDMRRLGELANEPAVRAALERLPAGYRAWIQRQRASLGLLDTIRRKTASDLLIEAEGVAARMERGIERLATDPLALVAFRVANRAMARAAMQRRRIQLGRDPEPSERPTWYPFQLAFLLLTLGGIADPSSKEREIVDLLFFPTGGGKTEAYLGLAAFTMVHRRLSRPGVTSAGVSVLMRYTLRLLTLDQLSRAAALVCALELEREHNPALGERPFEIGLWVGRAATPNRMGRRGDKDPGADHTAYIKTQRYQRDSRSHPAPIPLEDCPWCGTHFESRSFRLVPNLDQPGDLEVRCLSPGCAFSGDRPLPIVAVDEPLYRRLPAFVIATVDKFAALPWTYEVGSLFGRVEREVKDGFAPAGSTAGTRLEQPLPPPDLVIQDELHLISGPLGTIAGLYEAALEALMTGHGNGAAIRPKIVASTATVRRASAQIRALFGRPAVCLFPPPGPDRRDTFFARTADAASKPPRLYIGVAAAGRSLKVVLLRTALALLSRGQELWQRHGAELATPNPADPYMTLLGYFNSLRELGGSRRIIEDEVRTRLESYARRRRIEPPEPVFSDRKIALDPVELTSRVGTNEVARARRRLALDFRADEHVDVALATNMISVGLDILRLGLMVVLGQPKTTAEYIQATSRVGRDANRPGLVVTLLNLHKPRDRSHYERFASFHTSFYRGVEATSVTPFSPRALDRALPAVVVGLCRHGNPAMTPPLGAGAILHHRSELSALAAAIAQRAEVHSSHLDGAGTIELRDHVQHLCEDLLDDWLKVAKQAADQASSLQYQQETAHAQRLLYDFLDPDLVDLPSIRRRFRANRSMRDVEPSVAILIKGLERG